MDTSRAKLDAGACEDDASGANLWELDVTGTGMSAERSSTKLQTTGLRTLIATAKKVSSGWKRTMGGSEEERMCLQGGNER